MSDKALLEAAAAAAGYRIVSWSAIDDVPCPVVEEMKPPKSVRPFLWAPHRLDGDAFRLGVKLKMGLHYESQIFDGRTERIVEVYSGHRPDGSCHCETVSYTDDPLAATRLAIVRAAAALAERKE